MATYISQTATAKIIRQELKAKFPGTKFSVKKDYNSVRVKWVDGPAVTLVNSTVKFFAGASFDGMYDLKSYVYAQWNGEEVQFGCDYVFCERTYTRAFVDAIIGQYQQEWGHTTIGIGGNAENAWLMDDWEHQGEYRVLSKLMEGTSASDINNEAQAQKEELRREQERQREEAAKAERIKKEREAAQRQAEQEARDRAYREREALKQAQGAILTSHFSARMYLGVPMNAERVAIKAAFAKKVREASDGRGGYTLDMDWLIQVRDKALG